MKIEVLKPGMQSQLQDLGRYGYQHLGVPVGGAMDEWSHRLANLLVGNDENAATLEIVMIGPTLRFVEATPIAICGADLSPKLDGEPVPMNCRIDVRAGAQLEFGRRANGMWSYLAVRGGFAVAPMLGSRSTFARGGFGGLHGRALRKGDELRTFGFPPAGPGPVLEISSPLPSVAADSVTLLRIIPGEHWSGFDAEAQKTLSQACYRIGMQSDRMGYRLEGPPLSRQDPGELISEGVNFGTIQVPPDGQPIVLMAERQTTGGYQKIAHVISVDLPLLAQMAPQQELRFVPVSLEEAQRLYLEREEKFTTWRKALAAKSMAIDLNCDMGEGMGDDIAMLDHVTSANIACGYHAGDAVTMRRVVHAALAKGVAVGAHPSLPDREHFGRREMKVSPDDVYSMMLCQIGALAGFTQAAGARLSHVKPHGALYNMAAKDRQLADAIARAVRDFDPGLILFGLAGSEIIKAADAIGLRSVSEVFADRTYQDDGSLTPRDQAGAMIEDVDQSLAQVRQMLAGSVRALSGAEVPIRAETLCVHGDQPGALDFARRIKGMLLAEGIALRAPGR